MIPFSPTRIKITIFFTLQSFIMTFCTFVVGANTERKCELTADLTSFWFTGRILF